ncbi:unnamed protein product [marine sediment metagenome]|uniref:Uncharacterized protein n=1 Tax=marine sediment metagenome TaxID=412755 RepID=X1B1N3_9ZZZZ
MTNKELMDAMPITNKKRWTRDKISYYIHGSHKFESETIINLLWMNGMAHNYTYHNKTTENLDLEGIEIVWEGNPFNI